MCLPIFVWLVEFLPYFCVVTVPVFGSFCGTDLILRLSLLLYIYVIFSELISSVLCVGVGTKNHSSIYSHDGMIIPSGILSGVVTGATKKRSLTSYVNFIIWALIVFYIPVNLIPWPVIWLYDKVLWLMGPVLLVAEVILALNFLMHCSQKVTEKIEEEDSQVWKIIVLCFSAACYAVMASFSYQIYLEGSKTHYLLLFLVLILCVSVHNMMWLSQEGILCDAAFTCLCSISVLYALKEETTRINSPLQTPYSWFQYDPKKSLVYLGLYVFNTTADNATLAITFLMRFLSPFFLLTLGIRLYSILYIIEKLSKNLGSEEEDFSMDYTDYEQRISPWKSPITMKLAVVFMFTQMTCSLFYESRGVTILNTFPFSLLSSVYPKDIVFGRIVQIVAVNCFYIWRLYCAEDWAWNDWFS